MSALALAGPTLPAADVASGLAKRLALTVEHLCRVVAARGAKERALAPMVLLLWTRLRRMAARFEALVAHVRDGKRAPASRPRSRGAASCPPGSRPAAARLPRGFGWIVRLMPEAAAFGTQLQYLLADADMPALLAAEPRLGRIFRPLCHMLAVRPGPELASPKPHDPELLGSQGRSIETDRAAPACSTAPPRTSWARARRSPDVRPAAPPFSRA